MAQKIRSHTARNLEDSGGAMRLASCVLLALLVAAVACRDAPSAPEPRCEQPRLLLAGVGDFRDRLARQVALAPPDSALDVALIFADAIVAEDRAQIARYGGEILYEFRYLPALSVRFRARALGEYVAADPGRLTNASLGLRVCALD
jgi:hypothetical protein